MNTSVKNNVWINISLTEMRSFLEAQGFAQVHDLQTEHGDPVREAVFSKSITFEGLPTVLRCYTGIWADTGLSRGAGRDAVRLVLARLDEATGRMRVFKSMENVRRTGTWRTNILKRIATVHELEDANRALARSVSLMQEMGRSAEAQMVARAMLGHEEPHPPVRNHASSTAPNSAPNSAAGSGSVTIGGATFSLPPATPPEPLFRAVSPVETPAQPPAQSHTQPAARPSPLRLPWQQLRCPRCGAGMTAAKNGRRGAFHGCSAFPRCHGLRDAITQLPGN